MNIKATLQKRVSKKGNEYVCIVVSIADGIEKIIFLTPAELKLIEILNQKN